MVVDEASSMYMYSRFSFNNYAFLWICERRTDYSQGHIRMQQISCDTALVRTMGYIGSVVTFAMWHSFVPVSQLLHNNVMYFTLLIFNNI